MRASNKTKLALIAACCAAPLIAAYFAYFVWQPKSRVNYGELIPPRMIVDLPLKLTAGGDFRLKQLHGKWVLLQIDNSACDAYCEKKLYDMRQVRLAQGPDMDRIERVWLVTDGRNPEPSLTAAYGGTWMVDAGGADMVKQFPGASAQDHIYLVDPLGNLIMRYPRDPDPAKMLKDLQRLMKYSWVG